MGASQSEAGLDARIVSSGGTPNIVNLGRIAGATEHRAGTYIFNDRMMYRLTVSAPAASFPAANAERFFGSFRILGKS